MFNRVKQILWPNQQQNEKKQEFLDRLKGLTKVQIKDGTPIGVTFMVTNEGTGHVDNYFQMGPEDWVSWGTSPKPEDKVTQQFTTRQLELHLTDMMRKARPDGKITMIDESCCIKFGKQ